MLKLMKKLVALHVWALFITTSLLILTMSFEKTSSLVATIF